MIKAEWSKIFQSKKVLIAIIAVLFVPVLYAGMFLWAFWDPYAHLEDLPVAIVNNDEGATIEGKEEQFGKELVDNLIKSKNFKFTETSQEQGSKGLKNRDYYLEIVIPKDFSKNAASILEDDPEQMKIIYKPNEGFNFLGGQIGNSAVELVRKEVNKQVSATYAKTLYANIKKMGDGFGDAADGAGKLEKGAGELGKGANQLNDGIKSAKDGATQLADGAKSAAVGSNDLKNGIDSAKDGSSQLQSGSSDLKKGTETLVSGLEGNTSNINALNNGAQKINDGVGTLSSGLSQLAPGASNVSNGVSQLVKGLGEMPSQISSLQTGVANLNNGASDLTKGTKSLAAGTKQLIAQIKAMNLPADQEKTLLATATAIDTGASNVNEGATKLSAGTTQLNNSVVGIKAPTTNDLTALKQGAAQVSTVLDKMNKSVSSELAPGTKQLAAGTDKLASNWSTSIEGAKKLDTGAGQLNTGIASLNNGLGQLQTGSGQLASGLGTLSNGTESLVSGAVQLADGSQQLADGTTELKDGAGTLQSNLADAHKTASSVNATQKTYDMVGEPVGVEKQEINKVPNYGTGFAPYFISLGLFVGALLISIVFPLVEPAIKPKNGFSWFASKTVVLAVVGLIQSLIVVAIAIFGLKIEIANVGAFILMALITSYAFIALVQMLVTILGDPGRFLAIIVLILQLTTSAGTFPLELVPKALHIFNPILPMTYSVQGFKAAISTGDMGFFGFNSGILLIYMVVFLAITCGYFALLFAKRYSKEAAAE
ncbi:YhgE/Pip family protein [Rummeliibacillus pycnus]|uniref:YhgE/Pip family protein n=1 Tax=Rummeliibacillus pycnus TaxID=101070 RepID=UPI003D2AD737